MLAVYLLVAGCCYYYFGDDVSDLVTHSFDATSLYATPFLGSWLSLSHVIAGSLALHCVVLLPILIFAQVELLYEALLGGVGHVVGTAELAGASGGGRGPRLVN